MKTETLGRILIALRREQAKKVMPMIGPMLDAWDGLPNDIKSDVEDNSTLAKWIDRIAAAMEE